ncbi:MAG: hypothetical protein ACC662_10065, partial [Planctomycetota bacterium]
MLDHLKSEAQRTGGAQTRLRMYMAALLVLGAVVLLIAQWPRAEGTDTLPQAPPDPVRAPEGPTIDRERLPPVDDDASQARWQREALDYLLGIAEKNFLVQAETVTPAVLDGLPFAEARGRVFEVRGKVADMAVEEYGTGGGRLWSVVLEGKDGHRVIVLKQAFASDQAGGRPEDALRTSTEYIQTGDALLVRGIYLQRRVGTVGSSLLRKPVPALVATPPSKAFRKVLFSADPISSPADAAWDDVKDRFLRDTRRWDEPALYQVIEWARRVGHEKIHEDIVKGRMPALPWGQETFLRWSEEIESKTANAPRPFTHSARGKFFSPRGLVGDFVYQGWDEVTRLGSSWGVNHIYTLDVQSDEYGNAFIRTISAFPLSDYAGVTGKKGQHVTIYGFFLKNHTYESKLRGAGGGPALVTMPLFIVVDAEPILPGPLPYQTLVWGIAVVIFILAVLFYFVLIRGEGREAARMERYRAKLKRRIREREGLVIRPPGGRGSSDPVDPDPGASDP